MTQTIRYRSTLVDPFTEGQSEWWNEAPNKSRILSTYRAADGTTAHFLLGSDGTTSFLYDDTTHEFDLYSNSQWDLSSAPDLKTATQQASRIADMNIYNAVLSGTEMIGGRIAYVLDFTLKSGIEATSSTFQPFQLRKKLWIDQQTYLVLREQDWAAADTLVYETQYQHLDINPTLDPSFFAPNPPANAIVADMRPATPADIAAGWREIAGRLTVSLFEATKYPDWMVPGRPYYAPSGVVSQTFRPASERHGAPSMIISQGPPGATSLNAPDWGTGQEVQIGTLSGRIYSKRQAYILIFDRDGTRIKIYLPAVAVVTPGQIRQIAQSLQPIPR
jgi:outer membrane lipoprotein-sorting protein